MKRQSKVLLIDMALEGGNIVRQLAEGRLYWFVDIEVVKTDGLHTSSKMRYYSIDKKRYPKYEDALSLITTKFAKPLSPKSLPAPEA